MNDQQKFQAEYDAFGNIIAPILGDQNPESNAGMVYLPANQPTAPGALQPGQTIASLTFQSGYSQRRIRISMNPEQNPAQNAGSFSVIDEDNNILFAINSSGQASSPFNSTFLTLIEPDTDEIGLYLLIGPSFHSVFGQTFTKNLLSSAVYDTAATGRAALFHSLAAGETFRSQKLGGGSNNTVILNDGSNTGIALATQHQGNGFAFSASESATGTGIVAQFDQLNSANSNTPVVITNSATVNTNFKQIINFGGLKLYISTNGSNPNGVVTGNKGDVCLNTSATGQLSYCTLNGSNVWVQL